MPAASGEPISIVVEADGRKLHVVQWGDAASPAVVLLHGMRDHARSWDWVAAPLCDRYRVIAPDLRGHGDSDWVDAAAYTIAAFVLDLADIIAALGLERFALVGHSLGGAIGLRYAGIFPECVAAFCGIECVELPIMREQARSPASFPMRMRGWIVAERERRKRTARIYPTIPDAQRRMADEQPALDSETIEHLVRHAVVAGSHGGYRWKYDNAARFRAPDDADGRDLDEILAAVECPVLLAYGEQSWIPVPATERLALLRNHRVMMFPGASHWLHHQSRDAFIAALDDFLHSVFEGELHA